MGDRARAGKLGSAHRLTAPYQALRTGDGYITVGGNTQPLFERLCAAVGRPELIDDPRFATNDERMANVAELVAELEAALAARGTDEWVAALVEGGVPCGPIHDYEEVFADPHTQAREMEVTLEHPVEGTIRALGIPVKLSDTPGRDPPPRAAARPALGGDPARGRLRARRDRRADVSQVSWSAAARRCG